MEIYQKVLALMAIIGLGAIFFAGTCLLEEIFRKKYHAPKVGEKIIDKFIFLFLGIFFTVAFPFLIIDTVYQKFDAEMYWILSKDKFLLAYYGVCLLLWMLSFMVGKRKGLRT
jgi:hypothetical protein